VAFPRKPALVQVAPDGGTAARTRKESSPSDDIWDNVKRIIEGKRKVVLTGLLPYLEGELRGDEFVVYCSNEVFIERLKEPDKWSIVLSAVEEAASRPVTVRLEASAEKKSPRPDVDAEREATLERQALSDNVVLEAFRVFPEARLVKVIPLSSVAPDVQAAVDEESEEASFAETPSEEEET